MNLVYVCVFDQNRYEVLQLWLQSLVFQKKAYSKKIHVLIVTTNDFRRTIEKQLCADLIHLSWFYSYDFFCLDSFPPALLEAGYERLSIFNYPKIYQYNKILYMNTDRLFNSDIEALLDCYIAPNKIYALEQEKVGEEYLIGETPHPDSFRSGILFFCNSAAIKSSFKEMSEDKLYKNKICLSSEINIITTKVDHLVSTIINNSQTASADTVGIQSGIESLQEKISHYDRSTPSKKILTIMACHVDSPYKYEIVLNNIRYIEGDLIIINSENLPYHKLLLKNIAPKCKKYMEIENNDELDIGKMIYGLQKVDYSDYDFIVFTNDSFWLTGTLRPWYNGMKKEDRDLYGYTSNIEYKYHYQSFLYGIKKTAIPILLDFYHANREKIVQNVIHNFELLFTDEFSDKACFVNVPDFPEQFSSNLFFYCDVLYGKLLEANIIKIVKLKRILAENG